MDFISTCYGYGDAVASGDNSALFDELFAESIGTQMTDAEYSSLSDERTFMLSDFESGVPNLDFEAGAHSPLHPVKLRDRENRRDDESFQKDLNPSLEKGSKKRKSMLRCNDNTGKKTKISRRPAKSRSGVCDAEKVIDSETVKKNTGDIPLTTQPGKDCVHVRARRGQATDSHSIAERIRREKIRARMKVLQDMVPGCKEKTGKALMLDEIINHVQSLQCQVEFLSMKLATVSSIFHIDMDQPSSIKTMPFSVRATGSPSCQTQASGMGSTPPISSPLAASDVLALGAPPLPMNYNGSHDFLRMQSTEVQLQDPIHVSGHLTVHHMPQFNSL